MMHLRKGLAAALAFMAGAAADSHAQSPARVEEGRATNAAGVSVDVAAGMMKYGPHARAGVEATRASWPVALRLDALIGFAPAHDIPGRALVSATAGMVLPIRRDARLSPYLFGGAGVATSRYLAPTVGFAAGAGIRLRVRQVTAFVDGRLQPLAGTPLSVGLAF